MFKNYLKIAVRNLIKQRAYSFINIMGLAVGIACCLLIALWVVNEYSFDRFHENADRIYRVAEILQEDGKIIEESASIPFPVGPTLSIAFPDVKTVRFYKIFQKVPLLSYGDKHFYESSFYFADSTLFDIFSFEMVKGNPKTALKQPFTIVITESMAQKYFGNEEPLGKILRFENALDHQVTGVVRDSPANSQIQFNFLASLLNISDIFKATGNTFGWTSWYWNPCHTYLLLPSQYTQEQFEVLLPDFVQKYASERIQNMLSLYLQPLKDIHLQSNLVQEISANGNQLMVYLFSVIAAFILLIGCINFMNLATARSAQRAKEIAVRKITGAYRSQLISQFLSEALLMSLAATLLALLSVELFLPTFNQLAGTQLGMATIGYAWLLAGLVVLMILVGLIAGSYPAFYLSRIKPIQILSSNSAAYGSASLFRKTLVVFQFCISIALLICAIVVYQQHMFLQEKKLGFAKEHMVMIPIRGTSVKTQTEAFKTGILQTTGVMRASAISNILGRDVQIVPFQVEGHEGVIQMSGLFVDHDFVETFGIDLLSGRGFSAAFSTDSSAFLLNEAAIEIIGWETPLGKTMEEGQVIGVVKDFNYAPLHIKVKPIAVSIRPGWFSYIAVRIAGTRIRETLAQIESVWRRFEPSRPFEPFFLDDDLHTLYQKEAQLGQIFRAFTLLAIIIACLGLFGLSAYATEQRTKEVGIRKVLGATMTNLTALLSKDFVKLVLLANVIAWPVAWYAANKWLQDFAYRIEMSWWVFALAGGLALIIALLTVSTQAIRVAMANPVDSLKYE